MLKSCTNRPSDWPCVVIISVEKMYYKIKCIQLFPSGKVRVKNIYLFLIKGGGPKNLWTFSLCV